MVIWPSSRNALGRDLSGGGMGVNWYRYGGAWGYQTDLSSGLLQLGHRFYWPELGRFLQQDPVGGGASDGGASQRPT